MSGCITRGLFLSGLFLIPSLSATAELPRFCTDNNLNRLAKKLAVAETSCRRALSGVEAARSERFALLDWVARVSDVTTDRERRALCLKEPRARRSICLKASTAVSRKREGLLVAASDKMILARAKSADRICGRLNQASAKLKESRLQCESPSPIGEESNGVITVSGPLLASSYGEDGEPKCDTNAEQKDPDAPTDGRCSRLPGMIVTADREPPVYIPIIGNRGPSTGRPGDISSNPVGNGGLTPATPPGFTGCEIVGRQNGEPDSAGDPICYKKIEPTCKANLAEKFRNIKARCPITGGYLESLLREDKFNWYFQDPRTVSTTDDNPVTNTFVEELSAFAGTFKGLMMGMIRLSYGNINLNAKHLTPDCGNLNPEVLQAPLSASNIDNLLVHEALHMILDIHHDDDLFGLQDPMVKFSQQSDCGEGEWPRYLK